MASKSLKQEIESGLWAWCNNDEMFLIRARNSDEAMEVIMNNRMESLLKQALTKEEAHEEAMRWFHENDTLHRVEGLVKT